MGSGINAIALFAVIGVSMVTSLALIVRVLTDEFGHGGRGGGG